MIMMWPGLVWCFLCLGPGMTLVMADMGQGDRGGAGQARETQTSDLAEMGKRGLKRENLMDYNHSTKKSFGVIFKTQDNESSRHQGT